LPSLAIELLVENAIKHNSIKASSPLKISITISNGTIEVSNNIQLRFDDVDSTEVGLKNLVERMRLLKMSPPVSTTSNGTYRTIITLLPPQE